MAKHNACGLLRTVVEQGLWHFLSQADEYNAIQRLRRATDAHETNATQWMHTNPFLSMPADRRGEVNEPPALSEDALIVQTVTADLQRAGVTSDVFRTVQRHGYLRDWDQERWLQAEQEMAQARLLWARQQYHTMELTSIREVIEEGSMMTSRFMTASLLGYLGPAGAHAGWSITVTHYNFIENAY